MKLSSKQFFKRHQKSYWVVINHEAKNKPILNDIIEGDWSDDLSLFEVARYNIERESDVHLIQLLYNITSVNHVKDQYIVNAPNKDRIVV